MQIVTPAQAAAGIRSGDQVYVHCAAAAPSVLLDALVARAPEQMPATASAGVTILIDEV